MIEERFEDFVTAIERIANAIDRIATDLDALTRSWTWLGEAMEVRTLEDPREECP